jgi:hypothetical protein
VTAYRDKSAIAIAPPFKCETSAYIDTVELFFRCYLPRGILRGLETIQPPRKLKRRLRHSVIINKCVNKQGLIYGYRVIVHQPSPEMLAALDRYQTHYHGVLRRFDVAVDFTTETQAEAEAIARWLKTHVVLRWRRPGNMLPFQGGINMIWTEHRNRTSTPSRNLELYADKPSKVGNHGPCAHLELKFQRAAACRRAGIHRVTDLEKILDPAALFKRHLALSNAGDESLTRAMQITVAKDRERHRHRKPSSPIADRMTDRYRASLRGQVISVWERGLHDCAQSVKDSGKRIQTVPFELNLPTKITTPLCQQHM